MTNIQNHLPLTASCEALRPHWNQVTELSSWHFTLFSTLLNHSAQCWFSFVFCLFSSQFCEVITLSWLQHLSGKVVRVMLDYVDQVQICSKLKAVLEKQRLWPEIHFILTNPRSLQHLCRLKIRKCMGRLRLRCPVFMSFLPLPNLLKAYVLYKEYDLFGQERSTGTW